MENENAPENTFGTFLIALRRITMYIYQNSQWPNFAWSETRILPLLSSVRNHQGRLAGKMSALGFQLQNQANFEILTQDVLKTSEIEGEMLSKQQVRSSVARRLGLDIAGLIPSDRNVDGAVEMMFDATRNYQEQMSKERLCSWQSALFPGGFSGMYKVITGSWRDDSTGPMQVVLGPLGKEKVHFQAPEATRIEQEMKAFLKWFNETHSLEPVIKAGIAHLWFLTIHPFEDGNGRIARALTDMLLARSDNQAQRFYSLSAQIRKQRKSYYEILEKTQKGSLDITEWLVWFLKCLLKALENSEQLLEKVIFKHGFWIKNVEKTENGRQRKMLNLLLEGFEGNFTTSKWAKINKCSPDTALRDIRDLVNKGVLKKLPGGGRSTAYGLAEKRME